MSIDTGFPREQSQALAERYRILLEINNAIITRLTSEELSHAVFSSIKRLIPFDYAGIHLHEPETRSLRVVAQEGDLRPQQISPDLRLKIADSAAGLAFTSQRPVLRRDLLTDRCFSSENILLSAGLRALCSVPLVVQNRSLGTFSVTSQTPGQYSEEDSLFLQEAGNQVALAIANMQAYEEIAALKARLQAENVYLQEEIRTEHNFEEIVGNSPALMATLQMVGQIAATNATALILGETGTGKELIARAIHDRSTRKLRPLVKVNCGAIPAGLVESELFGHARGAFTGAIEKRVGRFELADGGTLFLDEVGELPLDTQVRLLRVLQEGEFEPVGSSQTRRVDVRIIAATNRNLEEEVRAGRFRADLYYRLNVLPIGLPPLRERREDLPQLVGFFLSRFARRMGRRITGISQETMNHLLAYDWPGNIRELQNVIERAVALSNGSLLTLDHDLVPSGIGSHRAEANISGHMGGRVTETPVSPASPEAPALTLEEIERNHILAVLEQTAWVVEGPKGAARVLGINPNTLRSRLRKLGIRRPRPD